MRIITIAIRATLTDEDAANFRAAADAVEHGETERKQRDLLTAAVGYLISVAYDTPEVAAAAQKVPA